MTNKDALNHSTALSGHVAVSPKDAEKRKSDQQRAEDWIYTFNHSVTCLTITDTVGLSLAANAYNAVKSWITGTKSDFKINHDHDHGYSVWNWLGDRITGKNKDPEYVKKIRKEEHKRVHHAHDHDHGHDHGHHHHHDHGHDHGHGGKAPIHPDPAPELTPDAGPGKAAKKYWNTSKRWLAAEAMGDIGSVPFTIALQRYAPGFMEGVRNVIEPVIGKGFRTNTMRAAKNWGSAHGYAADSKEVKDRAHELYEYEMRHMPQMAVWTVSSIGLNFAAMHAFHHIDPRQYEKVTVKEFAVVKGLGAAMTAALVLGVRGLIPGGAHKWDQTVGKYVALPVTKAVGSLFGVKSEQVDEFQKQRDAQNRDMAWQDASEKKHPAKAPVAEKEEKVEKKVHEIPTEPKTTVQSAEAEHVAPDMALAPALAV